MPDAEQRTWSRRKPDRTDVPNTPAPPPPQHAGTPIGPAADPQRAEGPDAPEARRATEEAETARRRRRAQFLRELHEAKALRDRVQPRRARAARMRQAMRMRTFRW